MRGTEPIHPAVRHLVDAGLVEGSVLAVAPGGASALRDALGATVVDPLGLGALGRSFRTVLDLGGLTQAATATERTRHARLLEDVVEADGWLHTVVPSDRDAARRTHPGLAQGELLRVFHEGWTLLAVHDSVAASRVCGQRHAWLASFLRAPVRRRKGPSVVRHFTDLGNFGSLDLGRAADRPPWGM